MYYILTIISMLLIFVCSYQIADRDVMEPPVILSVTFLTSLLFASYNYNYWHLAEFSGYTSLCIFLGCASFMLGGAIAYVRVKKQRIEGYDATKLLQYGRVEIKTSILLISNIISIIAFIYFIWYYRNTIGSFSSFAQQLVDYKNLKTMGEVNLPTALNILTKVSASITFVSLAIQINNLICRKFSSKDLLLLINILLYTIQCLLNATRGLILSVIFGGIVIWYILYHRIYSLRYRSFIHFTKPILGVISITLIGFWAVAYFRNASTSSTMYGYDFFSYICNYLSGSVSALDVYFKQSMSLKPDWFGQETFVTLNNNLSTLFNLPYTSSRILEYRTYNGYSVVNIYTMFRRAFHDFGWLGIIILSTIQGFVCTKMYRYVKSRRFQYTVDFALVFYAYYFISVPFVAIEDTFYTSEVSISGILKLLLLFLVYKWMMNGAQQGREKSLGISESLVTSVGGGG